MFTDHASGSREDRPELAAALDSLRPGDALVVWRLDRLGRSLPHLIDTVTGLAEPSGGESRLRVVCRGCGLEPATLGRSVAGAGWVDTLTVMAHNLGRAVGQLAGANLERATAATLRQKVCGMPGRLVHTGRRRHLRLPASWPWADAISTALAAIHTIPLRC